jgi:hypothetical protein
VSSPVPCPPLIGADAIATPTAVEQSFPTRSLPGRTLVERLLRWLLAAGPISSVSARIGGWGYLRPFSLCIYSWLTVVAAGALFTEDGVSAFEDAPVSGAVPCVPLLSGALGL